MSPKKWPLARKRNFFLGWFPWESCSPGYSGHLLHWQKSRSLYKKIDFWPQISKFWGHKSTLLPLAANWSLTDQFFQHKKGVSLESRYEGIKIFTPCPQKLDFGPKNGQIWPKTGIWAKYWHFRPIWSHARPKNNANEVPRWFFWCVGTKTFAPSPKKLGFWPRNGQNLHLCSSWAYKAKETFNNQHFINLKSVQIFEIKRLPDSKFSQL